MDVIREIRCPKCNHLLMKAKSVGEVETKCPSCKAIVKITDAEITIVQEKSKRLLSE
jgi:phage FluMu protein Com